MAHQSELSTHILIEVTCAFPQHSFLKKLEVVAGTTIAEAITISGIEKFLSDKECTTQLVGIFGKRANLQTIVQANDRVEIYRQLVIDPKEKRRLRSVGQAMSQHGQGSRQD